MKIILGANLKNSTCEQKCAVACTKMNINELNLWIYINKVYKFFKTPRNTHGVCRFDLALKLAMYAS